MHIYQLPGFSWAVGALTQRTYMIHQIIYHAGRNSYFGLRNAEDMHIQHICHTQETCKLLLQILPALNGVRFDSMQLSATGKHQSVAFNINTGVYARLWAYSICADPNEYSEDPPNSIHYHMLK